MATFRCGRFPDGEVPIRTTHGLVVFTDGRAEVDDPELAAALREVPTPFQITEDLVGAEGHGAAPTTPPQPDPIGRPPKTAPKPDWVAWATSHGMSSDQAEDLTKAQLIALADELTKE